MSFCRKTGTFIAKCEKCSAKKGRPFFHWGTTCTELTAASFTTSDECYEERVYREDAAHTFQRACVPLGSDTDFDFCVATWGLPLEQDENWEEQTFPSDEHEGGHLSASYMSLGVQRATDRHRKLLRTGGLRQGFVTDPDDQNEDLYPSARKTNLTLSQVSFAEPPVPAVSARPSVAHVDRLPMGPRFAPSDWEAVCPNTGCVMDMDRPTYGSLSLSHFAATDSFDSYGVSVEGSEGGDPNAPMTTLSARPTSDFDAFLDAEDSLDLELANAASGGATVGGARIGGVRIGGASTPTPPPSLSRTARAIRVDPFLVSTLLALLVCTLMACVTAPPVFGCAADANSPPLSTFVDDSVLPDGRRIDMLTFLDFDDPFPSSSTNTSFDYDEEFANSLQFELDSAVLQFRRSAARIHQLRDALRYAIRCDMLSPQGREPIFHIFNYYTADTSPLATSPDFDFAFFGLDPNFSHEPDLYEESFENFTDELYSAIEHFGEFEVVD
ncbi:hypothetical protein CYMTET_43701 [Cymbomonas tetramitiformis]|uniref:Uncharacterized protein n=1 Tax=Cymbomonas tetramitiformis TaxID=36881 RepID=A0AAE0C1Q5_9CHLO|nr:hypothetical protein CYMTET_43701 [Cymbomonas tetramitiformis]